MSSGTKLTPYSEIIAALDDLPILVRGERRRRGLSLRQVAVEADVSFTLIARFESGGGVNLANAVALMRWLDGAS